MAYTAYNWKDGSSGGTPITSARLNAIEAGLQVASQVADLASVTASAANTAATQALTAANGSGSAAKVPFMVAPTGTGSVATDTANLQNAINVAQAANQDLYLVGSYVINTGLSWNLARGSLIAAGHCVLNFAAMTSGDALTITGDNGNAARGPHLPATHRYGGFLMIGPNTDSSTVDGIYETDTSEGLDQGTGFNVQIYGFRDGVSFGNNVWSIDHQRFSIANCHRYGVNLSVGTNAGECITFTGASVYGTHNASNTGVAIYAPPSGCEARFIGGSFDYNDIEGDLQGGAITFNAVHIEDNKTGPMFKYAASLGTLSVAFRDCAWDSSTVGVRDHIHEITPSTSSKITLVFDGDKGGVYPNTNSIWLVDNSGATDANVTYSFRNFSVDSNAGSALLLGDGANILSNGTFDDTSTFVASPGIGGWTAGASGTWTIQAGSRGNALRCSTSTATSATATQRVRIGGNRQPLRIAFTVATTAWSQGSETFTVQFYAEDGTTPILGAIRIGSDVASATGTPYKQYSRRLVPPKGSAYMTVQLSVVSFIGTVYWDNVEVIPV